MTNDQKVQWKNAKKSDTFNMDILKIATAGSVDDGKCTLIGRILYETDSFNQGLISLQSIFYSINSSLTF